MSLLVLVKRSSLNSSINPLDVDVSILLFAASTSNPQTCEKLTSPAAIVVDPVAGSFLLKLLIPFPILDNTVHPVSETCTF